jgi:hypothetical protein
MRTFSVINGRFWTEMSRTGTGIREAGLDATALALYLVTGPHSNALGLYYLPLSTVSHDLLITRQEVQRLLTAVCTTGFARYFEDDSIVWIPRMAHFQIGPRLKPSDHRRAWALRELKKYEGTAAHGRFLKTYGEAYHLLPEAPPLRLVTEETPSVPKKGRKAAAPSRMAEAQQLSQLLEESADEH